MRRAPGLSIPAMREMPHSAAAPSKRCSTPCATAFSTAASPAPGRHRASRRRRVVRRPRLDGAPRRARAARAGTCPSRFPPRTFITGCRRTPMPGRRFAPRNAPRATCRSDGASRAHRARGRREPRGRGARGTLRGARHDRRGPDRARASRRRSGGDVASSAPARRGTGGARGDALASVAQRQGRRCSGRSSRCLAPRSTPTRTPAASRGSTTSRTPTSASSATSSGTTSRRGSRRRFPAIRQRSCAPPLTRRRRHGSPTISRGSTPRTRSRPTSIAAMMLDRGALIALFRRAPYRARNLLRWFVVEHGLRAPSAARLAAMLDQLVHAAPRTRACAFPTTAPKSGSTDGASSCIRRRSRLSRSGGTARASSRCRMARSNSRRASATTPVAQRSIRVRSSVRLRVGGERIRLAHDRPRRALKRILRDAGMPPWQRESLPLVFCGDALAAVPGIGVDAAFQARPDGEGCKVEWQPDRRKG